MYNLFDNITISVTPIKPITSKKPLFIFDLYDINSFIFLMTRLLFYRANYLLLNRRSVSLVNNVLPNCFFLMPEQKTFNVFLFYSVNFIPLLHATP